MEPSPIKKGGLGKIGGCSKKGVSLIFTITNPFLCYFSLECLACVCVCLFTPFLSVFVAFYRKNLVLLDLINRCITSTSKWFLKSKDTVEFKFLISANYLFNVMQIYAVSTKQVVLIYIYIGVCCGLCVCACVWYQIRVLAKNRIMAELSKLDALLHKTHSKVLLVLR